ncbi:MAG: hypothetical protein A4E36_01488 [Methanoregulaceae archaeon PtaB.Bin009]|jgi:hypothetical protein|nr:MAG: hypothetical protein A4E36_01488 [Methanoregulaceae archaeon PtaB.Bin009]OPY40302.1 MAG: hypothetical protein A4E41_01445 [Methanoregulaceae archaeon PtaU1.Bin066]
MPEDQRITLKKILEGSPFQDSIEIGTPGKGGAVKIYGDFADPAGFEARILEAVRLRKMASDMMGGV